MGRKGQVQRSRNTVASRNEKNIKKEDKEIAAYVDKLLRLSTLPQHVNLAKALENQREINAITDKIKLLEANKKHQNEVSVGNRTSAVTIERFTNWIRENGADFKGCDIKEIEGFELGLEVNMQIPISSLVITVPRKLMMTAELASENELKGLVKKDQILNNMPNVTLAIFLLFEKFKKESFWGPYIDILPRDYTTVLYFNVDELEELKGSPTLEIALKQTKCIARQYAYFHKLFHTSEDPISRFMREKFTYVEYCWAVSTVMTRQNTIPSEDGQCMINALIPLWDMCNHTNGTVSTQYNPILHQSECFALKDFEPGEQFFIFYGPRTNAELFIHNGFIYEDNSHDGYWIRLGISKSDNLEEKRTKLLQKLAISPTSDFFINKGSEPIDGALLAFLRIFNMNEEQLQHWLESDRADDLRYSQCALDTSLEKKSWTFLQARLRLLLGIYKTSIEEDQKLLAGKQLNANKRLAVGMRAIEKKILASAVEYVDQYIKQ
nr:histone-lysine N-methyltransferase setd3 [Leptinotarsa decemlineata]